MGTTENRTLHALVDASIEGLPPAVQAAPRSIVEIGTAHVVVLLDGNAAVRIGRNPGMAPAMRKRQQLVDSIPESVGFLLPRSLRPVVEIEGLSAVATRLIPGGPCSAGDGDPGQLQDLLGSVSSIPVDPLEGLLTEPLAFCGGSDWYRIQCEEVLPRLDQDVQGRAADAVAALANLEPVREVFAHGDLAGHNVFWEGNRIVGILDWDLASRSDRSTDLACIGAWNGWDKLPLIADSPEVRRAGVRRNTFRLQQVAFALLNGRPADEIGKAVARANTWLRERL